MAEGILNSLRCLYILYQELLPLYPNYNQGFEFFVNHQKFYPNSTLYNLVPESCLGNVEENSDLHPRHRQHISVGRRGGAAEQMPMQGNQSEKPLS
jgi:hypothetical protein